MSGDTDLFTDFARSLPARLERGSSESSISSELKSNISTLRNGGLVITEQRAEDFDRHGTELWNFSTRLRRDGDVRDVTPSALLRVFAFFLLDSIKILSHNTVKTNVRLLKAGNKAARLCLELNDTENAQNILSSAASGEDVITQHLQESGPKDNDGLAVHRTLTVEYLTLRIMLVEL